MKKNNASAHLITTSTNCMMLSVRVRRCNDEASARGKIDGTRPFPASGYFLRLEATGGMVIRRSNILHPPDRATRREHQHPREHGGRPRGTAGGDVRNSRRSLGICIASGDGIVPVGGKLLRDQHSHGVPTVFDKVVEMKEAVDCVLLFMVFRSLLFAVDTHYQVRELRAVLDVLERCNAEDCPCFFRLLFLFRCF